MAGLNADRLGEAFLMLSRAAFLCRSILSIHYSY
jgi:hypothetical protein